MICVSIPSSLARWAITAGPAARLPLETPVNSDNRRYLTAKAACAGHQLGRVIAALAETAEADAKIARLVP